MSEWTERTLLAENARLRAEVAASRAESVRLREAFARQTAQIDDLLAQVARLSEAVAKGNERMAELLAIVQRKKRSTAEPKKKEPPPAVTVDAEAAKAFEARPRPPDIPDKKKPEPKPRRPTGRQPLPEHLPAETTVLDPEACTCGCRDLDIVDEVVEVKLDVVREHQRRRVVIRKTGRCRACNKRTTARSLPAPFPRSKVTCDWLAWLVVQKFFLLLPLDRIRRDLALRGLNLSISFLVSQIDRAASLLDAIDGEHWKQLLGGPWMASDGTGLKVIVPGLAGTHNGYLEVYRRDELAVFQYEATKDGETVVGKLEKFNGVLVVDAESRFNGVFSDGTILEAGCNAHGFRRFEAAEHVQPLLAAEGGRFLTAVFAAEAEARAQGLQGDALRAWRQDKAGPLFAQLRGWMDAVEPTLIPDDTLAATIRYYRNHWTALTRFIDHPEIPPDNSGSEREFQNVAKARLSWLFAGSTEGAHRAATLLGVVATARNLGVNIQAYLTWAFERLGTHREHFNQTAAQLTPAAYKAAHPEPGGKPDG